MSAPECTRHLLARGAIAQIEYCSDCGVFHVSVDSVTVRFAPTALRDLRDTLCAALDRFHEAGAAFARIDALRRRPP